MKNSEIFSAAADVIERRGWWQSGYMPSYRDTDRDTCPVCVLAAINIAYGLDPDDGFPVTSRATEAAITFAELTLGESLHASDVIVRVGDVWNDAEDRTEEEVVSALREAAQAEAEAGR